MDKNLGLDSSIYVIYELHKINLILGVDNFCLMIENDDPNWQYFPLDYLYQILNWNISYPIWIPHNIQYW